VAKPTYNADCVHEYEMTGRKQPVDEVRRRRRPQKQGGYDVVLEAFPINGWITSREPGGQADLTRESASSSPTWRGRQRMTSRSTTNAEPANNGSTRASARFDGHGYPVERSQPTPSAFSFMRLYCDPSIPTRRRPHEGQRNVERGAETPSGSRRSASPCSSA